MACDVLLSFSRVGENDGLLRGPNLLKPGEPLIKRIAKFDSLLVHCDGTRKVCETTQFGDLSFHPLTQSRIAPGLSIRPKCLHLRLFDILHLFTSEIIVKE